MRTAALAAIALALVAPSALAQAPRPGAPANETTTTARPQISVQPPQPATPEQRPPQLARTEVAYFDNWQTNCQEFVNPARRQCSAILQLIQTNAQSNTGTVLVNWVVTAPDQQVNATIQTPTGVTLAPGIDLKVGRVTKKIPFARCDAQRCEGVFQIDEALARELTAADVADLVITALQGNAITFSIPIKGYERAVQALKR